MVKIFACQGHKIGYIGLIFAKITKVPKDLSPHDF
jgi:hypothetical protein